MRLFSKKTKEYTIHDSGVQNDFVNEIVEFFDGYLSLCNHHDITGNCSLLSVATDYSGITMRGTCHVFMIDGEHASETFESLKVERHMRQMEAIKNNECSVNVGDELFFDLFGCNKLHYVFTDSDDFIFGDSEVTMGFDSMIYTRHGYQLEPTLFVIKQVLLEKWPNAKVYIERNGLFVEV